MKNSTIIRVRCASNGAAHLEFHTFEHHTAVVRPRSSSNVDAPPSLRLDLKTIAAGVVFLVLAALFVFSTPVLATAQMTQELQMGLESHRSGNLRDAIDIYTAVIAKNKQSAEAFNWRGMAYDDMNELDKALADLNEAIRISSKYADAYNNRGEVYRKKNMLREAMADFRKAAELDRNFAEAHYNMGLVSEAEGRTPQAVRAYTEYLKLKPNAEDKDEVQAKIAALQKALAQASKPPTPAVTPPGTARPEAATPQAPKPDEPKVAGEKKLPPKPGQPLVQGLPPGFEKGMPQAVPGIPPEVLTAITGMGYMSMIVNILFYLFTAIMLFLIANKTGTGLAWLAFIPIANIFLMLQIARKPIWWLVLLLLFPVLAVVFVAMTAVDPTGGYLAGLLSIAAVLICIIAWLFVDLGIASARGKSVIWGILLFIPCTSPIALGYLGLSR